MKVPPKRKGNLATPLVLIAYPALNESPSEKEGKLIFSPSSYVKGRSLNESPSEKEGKLRVWWS